MKKNYDHIVVGSGISGLTITLLLAQQGKSVLLLEKGPAPGGSLARFRRRGVPFDIGFHFTGGFSPDRTGMLDNMLAVLGIRDAIEPRFLAEDRCHRIAFPSLNTTFEIPSGIERYRRKLKSDFPHQNVQIDAFFDRMQHVCDNTAALDITRLGKAPMVRIEEDHVSLQSVLDELIEDKLLQALLSVFCMCHGSRPEEISFADHARLSCGLYESTARVEGGGDAFLNAFEDAFENLDIDVVCNSTIEQLADIRKRRANRFVISGDREVSADACIFTIHPWEIIKLLPEESTTPAFRHRIADFEPAAGFFSLYGIMNGNHQPAIEDSIFSIFPDPDMNRIMDPGWHGPRPMVMLFNRENTGAGKAVKTLTTLELSLPHEVKRWGNSSVNARGESYNSYKAARSQAIKERIAAYYPSFNEDFTLLDTASMLTYRDYLHSPFGSAYGIKQKAGQFNLVGKLPIVNLYAAGQSSMLPGVVGAMTSAFIIVRALVGKQNFQEFIEKNLCQ